jgi:RNA polymerase sigma-70 factor (ECF subfamily)
MAFAGGELPGGEDRSVIEAVLAGDRERFGELVERHSGPVWGVISRFLANQDDAREVFQETWVRALERLASLKNPDRLRSWLFSIALNQCRSRHRSKTAGPRLVSLSRPPADFESAGKALDPAADTPGPAEQLVAADDQARLLTAIQTLPTRQREVLELRLTAGLSHGEIASALGIREDNARANLYQAMRHLKAQLQEDVS